MTGRDRSDSHASDGLVPAALVGASALATVLLTTPLAAWADVQDSPIAQSDTRETVTEIEEIVVTARRRTETLQSVPLSVSAFGEEEIDALQAQDLSGIQYAVPNLYLDEGDASNAVIFLRGIGQNDSLTFVDPGVSVYIDDVYISRTQAAMFDLFDVERIEVLRGPQGTLYGRNSPGGAVKVITRAPGDELEAYLEGGYGRFDSITARARISGRLTGGLKGKLAIAYRGRGGFNRNAFTGRRDGVLNRLSWRAGFYYEPHSDLQLTLTVDGRIDRPDTSRSPVRRKALVAFPDPFADPTNATLFPPATDNYLVETNANDFSDITTLGVALKAEWQLADDWALEAISAWRTFDFDLELDTDGSPLPVVDVVLFEDSHTFSHELRASYDDGERWSVTGGLFFFS
ncbi:MAG: hypothetical protein KatS3mg082_2437 [Nitrospiraceae bacterium]|nr:MAG: hypothetical protein KatS3mg082_2437 [Nitrospiraceae bacterium]